MKLFKYYLLIFSLCFGHIELIPVIMWDNSFKGNMSKYKFSSLDVENDCFETKISETLKRDVPIIVYLENSLSFEDLTLKKENGSTIFPWLSSFLNSSNMYFMPNVLNPFECIERIASPIRMISVEYLRNTNNLSSVKTMIINLKNVKMEKNRKKYLMNHDLIISKIHSKILELNADVLGIYTAKHPSWIHDHLERFNLKKILQTKPDNVTSSEINIVPIVDDKNLLLYAGQAQYSSDNGEKFKSVSLSRSEFTIKDNNMNLTLDGENIKVTIIIIFELHGYWMIDSITLNEKSMDFKKIEVPMEFSYHCSNFKLSNSETKQILKLSAFQIQPFKNQLEQQKFGSSFDCVGFMTIPICSGIFVVTLLLMILFCGINTMMDIETPDRFDDPTKKAFKVYTE